MSGPSSRSDTESQHPPRRAEEATSLEVIAATPGDLSAGPLTGMTSPDGALTLVLCDIADLLTIRDVLTEDQLESVLSDQRTLIERVATDHRGRLASAHLDGHMLAFDSAHAGLRCAIAMQRAFAGATVSANGPPLALRIGLHTGFVIAAGEDMLGRNVVLAARVADAAAGGEIVASAKLKEYTETDRRFKFHSLGKRHFRGVHGEHEIFSVSWTGEAF
jgi:adenylate cyclase